MILSQDTNLKKAVRLCEQGKFSEAKPILKTLIAQNPSHSEYHRILGQILSDEGHQDEAINCLIDALRWDSKNGYALLMMGNIFAKFKNDVPTAMKYYDQALAQNQTDYISLTNIGYLLLSQNQFLEAEKYLNEALKLKPDFANTLFSMAMLSEKQGDLTKAFDWSIAALKCSQKTEIIHKQAISYVFRLANTIIETEDAEAIIKTYEGKLAYEADKKIEIIADETIQTAAKMEFAEVYERLYHSVKFKSGYPAVAHLIMHELVHLDLVTQARKADKNLLFTSDASHKQAFLQDIGADLNALSQRGYKPETISSLANKIFAGVNAIVFNAPIDLFIEDFLFQTFPSLRPFQFISWHRLLEEAIAAVTKKEVLELMPRAMVSKTKIYSLVNAMQYKALYGIDLLDDFKAKPVELKQAAELYQEYLEYKPNKEAAEEYELVQNWAVDLDLADYFELKDEDAVLGRRSNIDELLHQIENDPYELTQQNTTKDRKTQAFVKTEIEKGINTAVAMYMADALQYFKTQSLEQIKQIAVEIALLGMNGFNTDKKDYKISALPDKPFSGYQILAWYYAAWAVAIPSEVTNLGLDYKKEFEMAKIMALNPDKQ